MFAGCDFEVQNLVLRRIYPFILGVVLFVAFCIFQARQFRRLYEHIKNDKWDQIYPMYHVQLNKFLLQALGVFSVDVS